MLADGMAGPTRRVDHIDVDPTGGGCIICLARMRSRAEVPRSGIDIRPVGRQQDNS